MSNQSFIKFGWQIGTGYPIPVPGGGKTEERRGGMESRGEDSGRGGMETRGDIWRRRGEQQ